MCVCVYVRVCVCLCVCVYVCVCVCSWEWEWGVRDIYTIYTGFFMIIIDMIHTEPNVHNFRADIGPTLKRIRHLV